MERGGTERARGVHSLQPRIWGAFPRSSVPAYNLLYFFHILLPSHPCLVWRRGPAQCHQGPFGLVYWVLQLVAAGQDRGLKPQDCLQRLLQVRACELSCSDALTHSLKRKEVPYICLCHAPNPLPDISSMIPSTRKPSPMQVQWLDERQLGRSPGAAVPVAL
jgi:hypothetical protein